MGDGLGRVREKLRRVGSFARCTCGARTLALLTQRQRRRSETSKGGEDCLYHLRDYTIPCHPTSGGKGSVAREFTSTGPRVTLVKTCYPPTSPEPQSRVLHEASGNDFIFSIMPGEACSRLCYAAVYSFARPECVRHAVTVSTCCLTTDGKHDDTANRYGPALGFVHYIRTIDLSRSNSSVICRARCEWKYGSWASSEW